MTSAGIVYLHTEGRVWSVHEVASIVEFDSRVIVDTTNVSCCQSRPCRFAVVGRHKCKSTERMLFSMNDKIKNIVWTRMHTPKVIQERMEMGKRMGLNFVYMQPLQDLNHAAKTTTVNVLHPFEWCKMVHRERTIRGLWAVRQGRYDGANPVGLYVSSHNEFVPFDESNIASLRTCEKEKNDAASAFLDACIRLNEGCDSSSHIYQMFMLHASSSSCDWENCQVSMIDLIHIQDHSPLRTCCYCGEMNDRLGIVTLRIPQ